MSSLPDWINDNQKPRVGTQYSRDQVSNGIIEGLVQASVSSVLC